MWEKEHFGHVKSELGRLKTELASLQQGPQSQDAILNQKAIENNLELLLKWE